mmetsp:Transcript_71623/g.186704  ORF Transcript_71623/g.186704 Transcript_71623/m.186704 type:complete len:209 (+) Transcript_71623:201-827(+)
MPSESTSSTGTRLLKARQPGAPSPPLGYSPNSRKAGHAADEPRKPRAQIHGCALFRYSQRQGQQRSNSQESHPKHASRRPHTSAPQWLQRKPPQSSTHRRTRWWPCCAEGSLRATRRSASATISAVNLGRCLLTTSSTAPAVSMLSIRPSSCSRVGPALAAGPPASPARAFGARLGPWASPGGRGSDASGMPPRALASGRRAGRGRWL